MNISESDYGLYIHIPFCVSKCSYCAFYSVKYNSLQIQSYLNALSLELNFLPFIPNRPSTIYLGGGTPSLIEIENLYKLFDNLCVDLSSSNEISIEVNPATISKEKIIRYKDLGINRISVGVQSLDDNELKLLSRIHNRKDVLDTLDILFSQGIENVSVDLIYGIPSQTTTSLEKTIYTLLDNFPIKHISTYNLNYEQGTKFYEQLENNLITPIDENLEVEMYKSIQDICENYGLLQYELSSFAKDNFKCIHNMLYWNNQPYIGLGASAHSFIPKLNYRWSNISDVVLYIDNLINNLSPIATQEYLGDRELIEERIMLSLRLIDGLDLKLFEQEFQFNLEDYLPSKLIANKFLEIAENKLRIPKDKLFLSNEIISELLIGIRHPDY